MDPLVKRIIDLESEVTDLRQPWLRDGDESERPRFERLMEAYESEKIEKEKYQHKYQQAKEEIIRRDLALSHRINKQEITKLQISRLGDATVTDLTGLASPTDPTGPTGPTGPIEPAELAEPTNSINPLPVPESLPAEASKDDSESRIQVDQDVQGAETHANAVEDLRCQVIDRSIDCVNPDSALVTTTDTKADQDRISDTIAHIQIICSGTIDLIRWIELFVEEEYAERPLADKQCHVGVRKLEGIMGMLKGSIGYLQGRQAEGEKSEMDQGKGRGGDEEGMRRGYAPCSSRDYNEDWSS